MSREAELAACIIKAIARLDPLARREQSMQGFLSALLGCKGVTEARFVDASDAPIDADRSALRGDNSTALFISRAEDRDDRRQLAPLILELTHDPPLSDAGRDMIQEALDLLAGELPPPDGFDIERVLGRAVDLARDLIIICDRGGLIVWCNSAFEERTGYRLDEVKGRKPGDFLQGPETSHVEIDRMRTAIRDREHYFGEILNFSKDGKPYWIEINIMPFGDAEGGGFLSIQHDATEHHRLLEEARNVQQHMRLIADAAPILITVVSTEDPSRRFFVNRHWQEAHGTLAASDGGLRYPPSDYLRELIRDLQQGEEVNARPQQIRAVDGQIRHFRLFGRTMNWFGEPAVLLCKADVTERVVLMKALEDARRLEELGLLSARLAHDLNNRLQLLAGSWDILLSMLPQKLQNHSAAGSIERALGKIEAFTQSVLAFSRRDRTMPEFTNLAERLQEEVEQLRERLPDNCRLDIDAAIREATADGTIVCVDPVRFEDALGNCVDNARDAMPDGGTIRIDLTIDPDAGQTDVVTPATASGGTVTLSIIDDGVGMDPDTLAQAADPFFSTKRSRGGSGLGLSTAKGLAVSAGGEMNLVSERGRGTEVRITLPRYTSIPTDPELVIGRILQHHVTAAESAEAQGPVTDLSAGEARQDVAGKDYSVLLVEDDDDLRNQIVVALRNRGCPIHGVGSVAAASRRIRDPAPIDLLISDFNLGPGADGSDIVRLTRELHPEASILIITAMHDIDRLWPDGDLPAVMLKPFRLNELFDAIDRHKPGLLATDRSE